MLYFNYPTLTQIKKMKVKYTDTFEYRVLQKLEEISGYAILRSELDDVGPRRQIDYAIAQLIKKGKLAKLGQGIFARLSPSKYTPGEYVMPGPGYISIIREALTKMGIPWDVSKYEKMYNAEEWTQIPVRPKTVVYKRMRRKLAYDGMEFPVEIQTRSP